MSLPGFSAETSLYQSANHYRTPWSTRGQDGPAVLPAGERPRGHCHEESRIKCRRECRDPYSVACQECKSESVMNCDVPAQCHDETRCEDHVLYVQTVCINADGHVTRSQVRGEGFC
jgi:hypothetical protein